MFTPNKLPERRLSFYLKMDQSQRDTSFFSNFFEVPQSTLKTLVFQGFLRFLCRPLLCTSYTYVILYLPFSTNFNATLRATH
jgi:hypothetical protein